jgi:hypothetical protein
MKKYSFVIIAALAFFAWVGAGMSFAQYAAIPHLIPGSFQPDLDASGQPIPPTLRILANDGQTDLTENWGPVPNVPVIIEMQGATAESMTLLFVQAAAVDPTNPPTLTTSAYSGTCTNYGVGTEKDFGDPVSLGNNRFRLTPLDSGGMAVVSVSVTGTPGFIFVIPPDKDWDGIPDWYEARYCEGNPTCLDRNTDVDVGPEGVSPSGDGIATIDEYRGFKVKNEYIRGDPFVKDVFVQFVETPQCISGASERDGSNNLISLATFYTKPDGSIDYNPLFTSMDSLAPGMKIHHIRGDEWVDNFVSYSDSTLPAVQLTAAGPETDRQINKNAIYPLGTPGRVKGVRLVECLDLLKYSPLGLSSKRPPDGTEADDGTAVIFSQRIWKSYKYKFALGAGRLMKYFTFTNNAWSYVNLTPNEPQEVPLPSNYYGPNQEFLDHNWMYALMKNAALPFYAAHEALGHGLDLTPTQEGTTSNPVGFHHVEGTGTNIDISIVHKIDKKTTGFNNFYIPRLFGISDKRYMRILESQVVQLP